MTENRKTAVYIRLSMEDGNVDGRTKLESDSVTSQRILLKSFVIDQLGVDEADILEYVDDGVSGTHFKRNGFQQLQEDMKSGQIGCVVVKDFSRFGRDYLEVGFYIEYIFPLLQIRFISINDSYDSAASSGMTGGMNVALKNLVYNMYSLDLSKKISSAMQTRMKNGTRLPVNARYGYRKGKDGRLEIDPDAAKVVKMIFQMAAEGMSFAEITRELNKQEIATCDERKISRGEQVQFQRFDTIMKNAGIQPQYLQSYGMRFILEPGYGVKHAAVCTPVIRRFLMTSLTGSGWKTTMIRLLTGNCLKKRTDCIRKNPEVLQKQEPIIHWQDARNSQH